MSELSAHNLVILNLDLRAPSTLRKLLQGRGVTLTLKSAVFFHKVPKEFWVPWKSFGTRALRSTLPKVRDSTVSTRWRVSETFSLMLIKILICTQMEGSWQDSHLESF